MSNPKYNASGCKDLTTYQALKNIEDEDRVNKLLATIFYIVNLAGFHVEGRIVLRDKRSGKIWR